MHSSNQASQKFWGLLKWKERWGLSWRGWLLLTLLGLASASLLFVNVHPFLAVTRRVDTNNLVVEGWIQRYAFRGAVKEFNSGSYEHIFTTGGPENGSGGYVNDYQTSASVGAEALKTSRLYATLLITILVFVGLWAYRTKRSQLHFMTLSRIDGLTGICNRQHFISQAAFAEVEEGLIAGQILRRGGQGEVAVSHGLQYLAGI